MWKHYIILLLLATTVQAELYTPQLSLSFEDFLGPCNEKDLNELDTYTILECSANAVYPAIPNPIDIFKPVMGERLYNKTKHLKFLPVDQNGDFNLILDIESPIESAKSIFNYVKISVTSFINIPFVLLFTFIELVFSLIKYLMVFAFRFAFTYLIVILGFQTIMTYLDRTDSLETEQSITVTFIFMCLMSILTLTIGGGWMTWAS